MNTLRLRRQTLLTIITLALFLAMIPSASYAMLHFGSHCATAQPCLIPVWFMPLIYAPSGVIFAGLALVLRDILQQVAGLSLAIIAVIIGSGLSYYWIDPRLALAAGSAYCLSELSETGIYTWLQKHSLIFAVIISATIGLFVDSLVFLHLAFHSYKFIAGQIIGKLWMVLLSLPLIMLNRTCLRKHL